MEKNTAGKWVVFAFEDEGGTNPGEPVTGDAANITANMRIDGGAANAVDDTNPTELEDGYYIFDITAAEANGDNLLISPQSATANINVIGVPGAVWTTPPNFNVLSVSATNGRVDVGSWLGTAVTTSSTTSKPEVDLFSVADDATIAAAIADQFDGVTGLLGDTYPATQSQINAIGSSTGSGIPFAVINDNVLANIEGVAFVGVQTTGTFANLKATDNVRQVIDDTGNLIDIVQEFNVGPDRIATLIDFKGILNGSNDQIEVQAYNWVGAAWETKAIYIGKANTSDNDTVDAILIPLENTGTGANLGRVLTRFITTTTQSNPTLSLDSVFVFATAQAGVLGFEDVSVWYDSTGGGQSGTAAGTGTASTPSDTEADARTIATDNNLKKISVIQGSAITLAQSYDGFSVVNNEGGFGCIINGQSLSGSYFRRASIIGDDSGTNAQRTFYSSCRLNGNTLGDFFQQDCAYGGPIVAAQASSTYAMDLPRPGGPDPTTFDFNLLLDVNLECTRTSTDVELRQMVASSTCVIHGEGGNITINANCVGGTVTIYGNFTKTDNSGGAVTVVENGRVDYGQIQSASGAAIAAYDPPTNAEMDARTIPSADYFDPAVDAVANVTLVATTTTNTDMRGTELALLASSYTAPDNTGITDNGAAIAALNDVAATDIVSAGAITTLAGAVVNVDLVDVTTTNTDMVAAAPTVGQILTTQMTEAYAVDGTAPTLTQSLMLIQQVLTDFAISGLTTTVRKVDGTTTAAILTHDDATDATSSTRTS
jgi:hypothetical protein